MTTAQHTIATNNSTPVPDPFGTWAARTAHHRREALLGEQIRAANRLRAAAQAARAASRLFVSLFEDLGTNAAVLRDAYTAMRTRLDEEAAAQAELDEIEREMER